MNHQVWKVSHYCDLRIIPKTDLAGEVHGYITSVKLNHISIHTLPSETCTCNLENSHAEKSEEPLILCLCTEHILFCLHQTICMAVASGPAGPVLAGSVFTVSFETAHVHR